MRNISTQYKVLLIGILFIATSLLFVTYLIIAYAYRNNVDTWKYSKIGTYCNIKEFSEYLGKLRLYKDDRSGDIKYFDGNYPGNIQISKHSMINYVIDSNYGVPYYFNQDRQTSFSGIMYEGVYDGPGLNRASNRMIQYISNGKWFILESCGPDQKYESTWLRYLDDNKSSISIDEICNGICRYSYDPTNGEVSGGDVIVTSPELGFPVESLNSLAPPIINRK